jgi:LysR family transcriptional regulator, regulator of abg operon
MPAGAKLTTRGPRRVRWRKLNPYSQEVIALRLSQIRDFLAVVDSGSIRAGARSLEVAQPTITKSIRSLESELHAQLLQRTAHGVVLTPAGRAFFGRARIVQAELRKAAEEVAQVGGEGEGSVSLGVGPASGALILADAVIRFRDQFPKTRIRIVEALGHAHWPLVRDGTLDLAVSLRPDPQREPALGFRPLFRMEFAVVARRGHPLRNVRSLARLVDADWLTLLPPPTSGAPLDRIFTAAGLPGPRAVIECDSHTSMITLLAKTDMLGTISRRLLPTPLVRDSLEVITVSEPLPVLTVGIITRKDPPLTRVAAAMVRAVTAAGRRYARSA